MLVSLMERVCVGRVRGVVAAGRAVVKAARVRNPRKWDFIVCYDCGCAADEEFLGRSCLLGSMQFDSVKAM